MSTKKTLAEYLIEESKSAEGAENDYPRFNSEKFTPCYEIQLASIPAINTSPAEGLLARFCLQKQ